MPGTPGRNLEKATSKQEQKLESSDKGNVLEITQQVEGKLENAEVIATGEVSETGREDKSQYHGGTGGAAQGGQVLAAQQIKIPPVEIMQKEISREVEKQIIILQKEAKRMMKSSDPDAAFNLNGIVAKIRELKDILSQLAYATFDTLKGWWLRFVKNISI